jgi:Arc/MetJ-type ribon-helix-helix transcriptional regulator
MYVTKKIGVSLPDELYEWAAREVEEDKADSVSGLIAESLQTRRARAELDSLVDDLTAELGEPDEESKARFEAAMRAADEAYRAHLARNAGNAAGNGA